MKNCRKKGLCCGAGGAQMFKDAEKGDKEINIERTEQAMAVKPEIIAAGCPFCNTMMTDGVKNKAEGQIGWLHQILRVYTHLKIKESQIFQNLLSNGLPQIRQIN